MRWFSHHLEVPHRLRAIVRARELSVIVLAAFIGAIAGLVVAGMGEAVSLMHLTFFGLDPGERLSGRVSLDPLVCPADVPASAACCSAWSPPISRAGAAPRSIPSKPMRCTAAVCRCAAA